MAGAAAVASMLAGAMPLARLFAAVFVAGQALLLMRWWRRVAAGTPQGSSAT
jgi:hypothetical protein